MSLPCRTSVSALRLDAPVSIRRPPVPSELTHPDCAIGALALPHGHAVPLPSPKQ
jgi:hypothetical protein